MQGDMRHLLAAAATRVNASSHQLLTKLMFTKVTLDKLCRN
jgi:hypothetical protein